MSFTPTPSMKTSVADTSGNAPPRGSAKSSSNGQKSLQKTVAPNSQTASAVVTQQTTLTSISTALVAPTHDTPSVQTEDGTPTSVAPTSITPTSITPTSIVKTTSTAYVTVSVSSPGSSSSNLHSNPPIPLILGIGLGGLAVLVILTFIAIYIQRKRRRRDPETTGIEPYPFFAPHARDGSHYDLMREIQSPASSTFMERSLRHPFYDLPNPSFISLPPSSRSSDAASLLKRDHLAVQRPSFNTTEYLFSDSGFREVLTRKMVTSPRNSSQVRQTQDEETAQGNDQSDSVGGRPPTYRTN